MKRIGLLLLTMAAFLSFSLTASAAISRTLQVEPWGFVASKMNLQYEIQTRPQRSLLVDGALRWDNNAGKSTYLAVGVGLRKYLAESFQGPWLGGKLQYIDQETSQLIRVSLMGGFKWVVNGGFTNEAFVGTRIDQSNGKTEIYPLIGYTIGYSY